MTNLRKEQPISIRLSNAQIQALNQRAFEENKARTEVVRDAIAAYLKMPSTETRVNTLEDELAKMLDRLRNVENELERGDKL